MQLLPAGQHHQLLLCLLSHGGGRQLLLLQPSVPAARAPRTVPQHIHCPHSPRHLRSALYV